MNIIRSKDLISPKKYVETISELINISRETDPTVIPHTEEELLYRYDKSLVYIDEQGKLFGHFTIYPTLINEFKGLNIGEMGSVVIHPFRRGKGHGHKMIEVGTNLLGDKYSSVVAATVNKTMVNLLHALGFDYIPFPLSYYEEGRKGLSGLMKGGEVEFKQRAKCMLKENIIGTKQKILELTK